MEIEVLAYISPFLIFGLLGILLLIKIFPRRDEMIVKVFSCFLAAAVWWSFAYIGELLAMTELWTLFWRRFKFIGVSTIPVFWTLFALLYTGRTKWVSKKTISSLVTIPLFFQIVIWTNSYHGLFYTVHEITREGPFWVLTSDQGPFFLIHAAFMYLLLLVGGLLILIAAYKMKDIYLKQSIVLVIATLIPFVGNLFFLANRSPFPIYLDPTPALFIGAAISFWYAIFKLRFLDVMPVARDTIFENISDAVFVFDEENRVVDFNRVAEDLINKSRSISRDSEEIIGKKAEVLLSSELDLIQGYQNAEDPKDEIKVITGEEERYFHKKISPVFDEEDQLIGMVLILRDVTERKEAEQRAEFLHSLLRHDLGNKLQITMGFLELLEEEDLSEVNKEYISDSLNSVEEGIELIKNVRTLNNLESGETEIREVKLKKTIDESIDRHRDLAKKLDFEVENNMAEEVEVKGGMLLKEMFSNLIENSLTHSNGNKIRISMEKKEEFVKVILEDDGEGIPDGKKGKITEKGFKGERSSGSGLGMHLVKKIIDNYEGKLKISDSKLGGARFEIILDIST